MTRDKRIQTAVYSAVDELNKQLPKTARIEKSPEARLYGASGKLESLDFVTLVMEVEEKIKAEFSVDITIVDDDLLSRQNSPFSTLRTLIDYLDERLKEHASRST